MTLKFFLFFLQCIILHTEYDFATAKALVGINVRGASSAEYPFVVSVMRINGGVSDREKDHACTGTLVSRKDVLTAEHCINGEQQQNIQVLVGSTDLRTGVKYLPKWWIKYNEWLFQKKFYGYFEVNDIAMIRLYESVPNVIQPAIVSTGSSFGLCGVDVKVAGWGVLLNGEIPSILRTVNLKVLSIADCENRIEKLNGDRLLVHTRYLCTVGQPPALLTFGDSGGPVFYQDKLIAINLQTCPLRNEPLHPEKVNIHLILDFYRDYIFDVIHNF